MSSIQCVIVGDGGVGKTSLVSTFTSGIWSADTPSTLFAYTANVVVGESQRRIDIIDTAGEEDQDRLRPQSYVGADVFILCFSVTSPSSFQNISAKWIPEVRKHNPKTPILLVATKSDLRSDREVLQRLQERGISPISDQDIKEKAHEIKARGVVECSALCQTNLTKVFEQAVECAQSKKAPNKSKKRFWLTRLLAK